MKPFSPLVLLIFSCGCAALPMTSPGANSKAPRVITIEGRKVTEEQVGKINSWVCRDFINEGKTLVEVGNFSAPKMNGLGFVIYDGGDTGEGTAFQRKGLNLRWDWGPHGNDFAFVIKADGTGLFFDFTSGEEKNVKANQLFKCNQR